VTGWIIKSTVSTDLAMGLQGNSVIVKLFHKKLHIQMHGKLITLENVEEI
jgi:hypothetical protein